MRDRLGVRVGRGEEDYITSRMQSFCLESEFAPEFASEVQCRVFFDFTLGYGISAVQRRAMR